MYESFTSNKLQDNAESSDTFINKAVLTLASYTRTVYYKYNRIRLLPFTICLYRNKLKNGFISTYCFHVFH